MKKMRLLLATTLLLSSLVLFSGCATTGSPMGGVSENFLGIVKVERNAYTPPSKTSLLIRTDELGKQKDYSGNKTELLWGLITIADY